MMNFKEKIKGWIKENLAGRDSMLFITFTLIIVFVYMFMQSQNQPLCKELDISDEKRCNSVAINCATDCKKLEQEYFNSENGGIFTQKKCSCYDTLKNEVIEVW